MDNKNLSIMMKYLKDLKNVSSIYQMLIHNKNYQMNQSLINKKELKKNRKNRTKTRKE